jgi:uncharacterized membrane protein
VIVDAPVDAVWQVVADVTRTSEWSHECHRVTWLGGATAAAPGVRFRGHNRSGRLRWSRVCEIVSLQAPCRIEWRTIPGPFFPDSTVWRLDLEAVGTRTRVVQTYRTHHAPRWLRWILARMVKAHFDRGDALTGDLHRIGAIAAVARRGGL